MAHAYAMSSLEYSAAYFLITKPQLLVVRMVELIHIKTKKFKFHNKYALAQLSQKRYSYGRVPFWH